MIGLLNITWGGSRIESWLPAELLPPPSQKQFPAEVRQTWDELKQLYPQAFSPETAVYQGPPNRGGRPAEVGNAWEWQGYPNIDGIIWFETTFELTASEASKGVELHLGMIDDSDSTYVNGQPVGSMTNAYNAKRVYNAEARILKPGSNVLSIRVEDGGGGGGLYSNAASIFVQTSNGQKLLSGPWVSRPQLLILDTLGHPQHRYSTIYNGMLHAISGFPAAGLLWYQGESNAGSMEEAETYSSQIRQLQSVFRKAFKNPLLPMVAVELPEFMQAVPEHYQSEAFWPAVRQSTRAIEIAAPAATVVAFGYGDADDIHPRDKEPIGKMMAAQMSHFVYGDERPLFARSTTLRQQGQLLMLEFENVGEGLRPATAGAAIKGFAVRDAAGRWYDAEAELIDKRVIRLIPPPGVEVNAVSYAWSNNPDEANLLNGYGLPVGSFRMSIHE